MHLRKQSRHGSRSTAGAYRLSLINSIPPPPPHPSLPFRSSYLVLRVGMKNVILQLVIALPEGVTLTVLIDACHSGSVLDLPYCILADAGTIAAVESGEQSSVIGVNPGLAKVQ